MLGSTGPKRKATVDGRKSRATNIKLRQSNPELRGEDLSEGDINKRKNISEKRIPRMAPDEDVQRRSLILWCFSSSVPS
ncbi:hypothetical protein L596_027525 [Steinernema carpocapsae]|uniref:Uncharacterized protein n=1 Tax=Steinernema carpocapsae TaxID=34508 RepID=A0A4U5LVS1_STECR|nr:hypothetical protein L596_027525 [Steinernema carpocapsae]